MLRPDRPMLRSPSFLLGLLAATLLVAAGPRPTDAQEPAEAAPLVVLDVQEMADGETVEHNSVTYGLREKLREFGFRCVSVRETSWDGPGDFVDPEAEEPPEDAPSLGEATLTVRGTFEVTMDRTSEFYGGTVATMYEAAWTLEIEDASGDVVGSVEDAIERGATEGRREARQRARAFGVRFMTADLLRSEPVEALIPPDQADAVSSFVDEMDEQRGSVEGENR